MPDREVILKKLFGGGKNAVIVAVDHGEFDGPIPGMIDLPVAICQLKQGADGILMSPGMFEQCRKFFSSSSTSTSRVPTFGRVPNVGREPTFGKNAPIPIVRLNWSTTYCFKWGYNKSISVKVQSPGEAKANGARMVLIALHLHTGSEKQDARNVEVFSRLCNEAKKIGMPVMGEYFPNEVDKLTPEQLHEEVYIGCRIIAELGADCVKTFYTNKFSEVTKSCPVPVLGLGAEKLPREIQALELADSIIRDGGKGVVFGRNVMQAKNPLKFLKALSDVVKRGVSPGTAAKKYSVI